MSGYESPWVSLLRICWDSWLNVLHQKWEMWLSSSQLSRVPLPLSPCSPPCCAWAGVPGGAPESTEALLILPPSVSLHCPHHLSQPGFRISNSSFQQVRPAIEPPLVSFSLQSLHFSAPEFLFGSTFISLLSYWHSSLLLARFLLFLIVLFVFLFFGFLVLFFALWIYS